MKRYTGATRTLNLGSTAYRDIIFLPNKPALDSEMNFIGDISSGLTLASNSSVRNSGFFNAQGIKSIGYDNTGETFGINATNQANLIILKNPSGNPFQVQVVGDLLQLGGTNCSDASQLHITLPAAPGTSTRDDLVFLEVWYQELISQSGNNEPTSGNVYTYGNTQYGGATVVADGMYDSSVGIATTNRVQLQYRVRIVTGVNFNGFPDGVGDTSTVFGQGSALSPSSYTFTQSLTDSGSYVAGDGSPSASTALGSVDGYVYAIPLFRVHRRNRTAFSLTNRNGAGNALASMTSDRPDGFFYDKIEVSDIEDLRHILLTDETPEQLLDEAMNQLLEGNLNTILTESPLGDTLYNGLGLEVDIMSTSTPAGTINVATPNGQRRCISDSLTNQATTQTVTVSQKTIGTPGGNWTISDAFIATALGSAPAAGVVIGPRVPQVYAMVQSGATQVKTLVPSTFVVTGGVTLTFTLASIPGGVTNQDLWMDFDVQYQPGSGLNFVPIKMGEVYEVSGNTQYGFCSVNALNGIRTSSLVTTASADDILIGRSAKEAFTTLGYIAVNGNGTSSVSIGANHGTVQIGYINAIYQDGVLLTRGSTPNYIASITKNGDNSFTIVFHQTVSSLSVLTFHVGLLSNGISVQEVTKSLVESSKSQILTQTITAGANSGSGLTTLTFQTDGYVFGTQAEVTGVSTFQDVCYVAVSGINNTAVTCTTTISGNFVTVVLGTAVGAATTDTVSLVVSSALSLDSSKSLRLYYTYRPYSGVTARQSFGTGVNSHISSKVVAKAPGFLVHTSGTNGLGSTIPAQYAPLLPKLPKAAANKDSDLGNNVLGAVSYVVDKGIDTSTDYTIAGIMNVVDLDQNVGWSSNNADTTSVAAGSLRSLYGRSTIRFDKSGTSTSIGTITKTPFNTNWSTVISTAGVVSGGMEFGFWYYIPDPTNVLSVAMVLHTGSGNHNYVVTKSASTPIVIGWNKALFTARTAGSGTTNTVTSVEFQVNFASSSNKLYAMNFFPTYLETAGSTVSVSDGDIWYSSAKNQLNQFNILTGMAAVTGLGYPWYKANGYSFGIPVVAGTVSSSSVKNLPYRLGKLNYLDNHSNSNNRGTPNGSNFYSVGVDSLAPVTKQAVMFLLEQVISDPTGNFAYGEYMLRVESKILSGTSVNVTNSDFESGNSVDVFRLFGRPLGKI